MNEPGRCLKCGAPLAASARQGVCPACLYAQATAESSASEPETEPATGPVPAIQPAGPLPNILEPNQPGSPALFGDYEILEKLGAGGMGTVFKARQRSLDRLVAIKVLPLTGPHARPEFIKRFRAEAAAAAALQHPNIVAIHEVGVHAGQHFFAMDYVAGRSLAELVGNRPLPAGQAARYLQSIAEAVHHAHERGILHRDLKPSNILIDAEDQPRVADFGLAKRLDSDSELTLTGQVLGSAHYIPPEQATGKNRNLTRRSDVYGLGAILYHLLTGRPPFVGEQMAETLQLVMNTDPVSPRLLNPLVPRDLETICLKCLEKEPAQRYPTAQAVEEELGRFLRSEPIAARPVGFVGRLLRWCRRKPALAGMAAALALTFVLGLTGILWAWRQTSIHAAAERQQRIRAEDSLTCAELERIESVLEGSAQGAVALTSLARVLRDHPDNTVASEQIVSVLTWRNFPLPRFEFSNVTCFAWSPEGERVASGTKNGDVRVWSADGGRPLMPAGRHGAAVRHLQFAPEGRRLVSASDDGTALVWDTASGQALTPALRHSNAVACAVFSADGRRIATAAADGSARVWDSATGQPTTPWLQHSRPLFTTRFSPDGKMLLTASWDTSVHLWEAGTGRPWPAFAGFQGRVQTAGFSPDSRWLCASDENLVHLWDTATGKESIKPLSHPLTVTSAEFTPDGQQVTTVSLDCHVRRWEARTGQLLARWVYIGDWGLVQGIQSWTNTDWMQASMRQPVRYGRHAEFSPSGQLGASTHDHSQVQLWEPRASNERQWRSELILFERGVRTASFSPDGQRLLVWSADGVARVWDTRPGQAMPILLPVDSPMRCARYHPDGHQVMTIEATGFLRMWDSLSGQRVGPALRLGDSVVCVVFSLDGHRVATASANHVVRVWDTGTGECIATPVTHAAAVRSVAFSQDGQQLATASGDRTARIWDARTGETRAPLAHDKGVTHVAFSPDGQRLLSVSRDGTVRVWDVRTGQLLFPALSGASSVEVARFTGDGQRLVTSSGEGAVRFYDARTGQPLSPFLQHSSWGLRACLNAKATLLATAGKDGGRNSRFRGG